MRSATAAPPRPSARSAAPAKAQQRDNRRMDEAERCEAEPAEAGYRRADRAGAEPDHQRDGADQPHRQSKDCAILLISCVA